MREDIKRRREREKSVCKCDRNGEIVRMREGETDRLTEI